MYFSGFDCLIFFKVSGVSSPDATSLEKYLCPSITILDLSLGELGTLLRTSGLIKL